jgi:predicted nucleic acid-binding protein
VAGDMYLDSCIIVKLLTTEEDSEVFDQHLTGKPLSSSELAVTEVWSALLSKQRNGRVTHKEAKTAWAQFQSWLRDEDITLCDLNSVVLRKANHVLESCHPEVPLRTLDAVHLASCDLSQDFPICSTDSRVRQAAEVLRIPVFPEV